MVSGVLRVNGSLRLDGEVEGQIFVTDNLVVGSNGSLKAEIQTGSAVVAGRVKGRIRAKGRVELQKGARLEGDVHASAFKIEDGAFFQGNCVMGEKSVEPAAAGDESRDDRLRVIGK
jgi:cytoskeletal protein CcmA (bactofilin family)